MGARGAGGGAGGGSLGKQGAGEERVGSRSSKKAEIIY